MELPEEFVVMVKRDAKDILCAMVANSEIATAGEDDNATQALEMIKSSVALAFMFNQGFSKTLEGFIAQPSKSE